MELYLSTRRDEAATANEDSGSPVAQRRHVLNELLTQTGILGEPAVNVLFPSNRPMSAAQQR